MTIQHIWACTCNLETPCEAEDQRLGAVFQCPGCKTVWGCVRPHWGASAWIKISESDVQFHRLLEAPETEDA